MDLNLDAPLQIASIKIEGANHTRRTFLEWLLRPYTHAAQASAGPSALTARTVLEITSAVSRTLQECDIFDKIDSRLDTSGDLSARVPEVDVIFKTKEKGRFFLKTATELGDGEGSASIQARVRNVFGGAERLDAALSMGTKTRRAFNLSLSAPLHPSLTTRGEFLAFAAEKDLTGYASHMEDDRGVRCSITTSRWRGVHEFAYEAVQRSMVVSPEASLRLRELCGDSIKSSIGHAWILDTRDNKINGTQGVHVKFSQELAGIGGDAAFYKLQSDVHLSRKIPFLSSSVLSLAAKSGLLYPLCGRPSLYPDRFQLGGPFSVRMFRLNSLGPKDKVDSLGGDICWAAGASLISAIPWRPHWPLKSHVFVNAGNLQRMEHSAPLIHNVSNCLGRPAVSVGLGLIYNFEPLRVELNFGMPLVVNAQDGFTRGFQFGVGLDFL